MAKLNADGEYLGKEFFFWTWEAFARNGDCEHENVNETWENKPLFIFHFFESCTLV